MLRDVVHFPLTDFKTMRKCISTKGNKEASVKQQLDFFESLFPPFIHQPEEKGRCMMRVGFIYRKSTETTFESSTFQPIYKSGFGDATNEYSTYRSLRNISNCNDLTDFRMKGETELTKKINHICHEILGWGPKFNSNYQAQTGFGNRFHTETHFVIDLLSNPQNFRSMCIPDPTTYLKGEVDELIIVIYCSFDPCPPCHAFLVTLLKKHREKIWEAILNKKWKPENSLRLFFRSFENLRWGRNIAVFISKLDLKLHPNQGVNCRKIHIEHPQKPIPMEDFSRKFFLLSENDKNEFLRNIFAKHKLKSHKHSTKTIKYKSDPEKQTQENHCFTEIYTKDYQTITRNIIKEEDKTQTINDQIIFESKVIEKEEEKITVIAQEIQTSKEKNITKIIINQEEEISETDFESMFSTLNIS